MTARIRRRSGQVGDVFVIPLDEHRVGFGQIVAAYSVGNHYLALFARAYQGDNLPDPAEAVKDEIALLALSLDTKIRNGDWHLVGNRPVNPRDFPLPAWKEVVGFPSRIPYVVDYSGAFRRKATGTEEALPLRTVVSPALLEDALKAFHGIQPWDEEWYQDLLPPKRGKRSDDYFTPEGGSAKGIIELEEVRPDASEKGLQDVQFDSAASDLDQLTLRELEATGADLNNPRHTIHYLSFGRKRACQQAQQHLVSEGYKVDTLKSESKEWLVMASKVEVVDEATIQATRRRMEQLALMLHGDYEGWEAQTD